MDPFLFSVCLFPIFSLVFSRAVFLGGIGTEKMHKKALRWGFLGLSALPLWLFCVLDLYMQLVLGVVGRTDWLLFISTLALFLASLGSLKAVRKIPSRTQPTRIANSAN